MYVQLHRLLFIFLLLMFCKTASAQPNWSYNGYVNFGCDVNFTYGKAQRFPGMRFFAAFIANGVYKKNFTVNYGPSISIYNKTLGANLNPLINDIEIDFTNSFSIGYASSGDLNYTKFFKTINTGSFYNLATNKRYAAYLSTNFILNNHRRNQTVGSVSLSSPYVTINYYNDGAAPFNFLPLADNFDRWWTGGFGIYVHNEKNYNTAEISFDQFTGYSPLLYELSNIIGINIPDYNIDDSTKKYRMTPAFNTSAYNIKIATSAAYSINAGVLGSLRTNNAVFGLQDIIHTLGHYPLHPNNDINRFYIGGTYNNMTNVKLQ
jgi:hypothetical protein